MEPPVMFWLNPVTGEIHQFTLREGKWVARVAFGGLADFRAFLEEAGTFYKGCEFVYEQNGWESPPSDMMTYYPGEVMPEKLKELFGRLFEKKETEVPDTFKKAFDE